ncbi:chemotaxis protein CheA [Parasaccharibacter sp. TMW2.1882]|uniref:Chemotaxis protein CheA n=1 Tax=Parasaccharibacter apium TaxID=1510841 RepID=A0ABX4ZPL5_9PROT|nr:MULTISPECIES: chemotaxis protein CheA [Parasaccharibacter]MCK8637200.1 chemotaxis protein CheA [Parasaccharibacter sp. TMW2.1885]MCL1497191.1 chemotaxis protein CheA [Parasaccharibacter sp. TMW2.1882]MCL1515460.1 chemotaxis protein CheA [Parasaccharibacter sp. TMW2.1890]POS63928.1 chemotaxis protein CheA [Parasaccharibacter apium]POS65621.1 chemotaxis protein CheA [Parasaccharibacter apium]
MGDVMDDILKIFFEECDELLPELESGLGELSAEESSQETINAIFRAVHSIKGGAASFGLDRLVRFAHVYESALDGLRSGQVEPDPAIIKTFFLAMDLLSDLVAEAKQAGDEVDGGRIDETVRKLEAIIGQGGDAPAASDVGETPVPEDFTPVTVDLGGFDFDEPAEESGESSRPKLVVTFRPQAELYSRGDDARNLLLGLKELLPAEDAGAMDVTCNTQDLPVLSELAPEEACLGWTVRLPEPPGGTAEDDIQAVFDWVGDVCDFQIAREEQTDDTVEADAVESPAVQEMAPAVPVPAETVESEAQAAAPAAPAKSGRKREQNASIRVDIGRIGMLMDMVGEMVIGQASLESALTREGALYDPELLKRLAVIKTLTRDIQEAVMAIRAQPVRNVFQRMQRVVREASSLADKDVALVLEGEETEVDRTLIENLTDPLTHMLRNAVDHGIETPQARLAAGKPAQGTIWLSARHRSGRILIEIRDDGGGINTQRVLQTAIKRGIVPSGASLGENEINELIFAPGFSTAETVSDLSGRGVGMDVVKQAIQNLGGRVNIKSTQGKGTLFTLSLPLTLAVLDGMLIECRGSTMVVPVSSVVELVTVQLKDDVYTIPDGSHVVSVRGRCIPLIYLGDELTLPEVESVQEETHHMGRAGEEGQLIVLVVENEAGARAALVVDGVRDQAQVVIKSIEKNYRQIKGVSAATILGDGSVSLILDVSTLIVSATKRVDTRALEAIAERAA